MYPLKMLTYKYTTKNFIKHSVAIHGEGVYDYSKAICKKSKSKVILRCIKHDYEFEQTASNHLKGSRCRKCGIESRAKKQTKDINKLIEKWENKHNGKYDYSKVKYKNNSTKIEIICPTHKSFWQIPYNHTKGAGCPKCASKASADNRRKPLKVFMKEANEKHKNKYDYSKVNYKKDTKKVCIICPVEDHGEFWQTPLSHIGQGCGCPKCGQNERNSNIASNTKEFIKKMKNKYPDKLYDYSKVKYKKATSKVIIICNIDKCEFKSTPNILLGNGGTCPTCLSKSKTKTTEEFIREAKEIHGTNKYNYSKVIYKKNKKKVCIICPVEDHGEFLQTPLMHLQGQGCSKCGKIKLAKKFS